MKQGYSSLQAFAAEIERRAEAKKDFIAPTTKTALVPYEGKVRLAIGNNEVFDINNVGHNQIAETVDIPRKYYDRLLAKYPELLAQNVNKLFKEENQNRLFRTLDGTLRAVRSDKFRTDLEYEDLMAAVLPVLSQMDVAIMSYQITETRLYLKVVSKEVERELQAHGGNFGDGKHVIVRKLSPAMTLSNSEVGFSSLRADIGVYDGFCSNLASFGEKSLRKYHVGARHELAAGLDYAMLSDDTKSKTAIAAIAQISDVVRNGFNTDQFEKLVAKIEGTKQDKLGEDVVQVVKLASSRLGLNEAEGKGVLRHLIEGGDLSRFGLYNAITRQSQDVEDYDRASDLERIGAQVIDLNKSEWRGLNKAKEAKEVIDVEFTEAA